MKQKNIIYTHYGHSKFDKTKFDPIKNRLFNNKPAGGFWASRKNAVFGWKNWNDTECFAVCDEKNKIDFTLRTGSRILEIHNTQDVDDIVEKYHVNLPSDKELSTFGPSSSVASYTIDFEKISQDYDAIECFVSDDSKLYYKLYTWDCDSILILNPDIIEPIIQKQQNIADMILCDDEMLVSPDTNTEAVSFHLDFNNER